MSPIPPNVYFELENLRLNNKPPDPSFHFNAERQAILQLFRPTPSMPSLDIDNNQDGVVLTLRQANSELVKELLLYMLSKNLFVPSSDIISFLESGYGDNDEKKEPIPILPNVQNGKKPAEKKSILDTKDEFLLSVNKAIEDHLGDENFRPNCLSKLIFLCEMQLHRKLKKLAGLSPSNYIRKYRLLRSLSFLKEVRLSISEVGYKVGFRSLEYFSRSFKKEFGMNPSEFKSEC